MKIMRSSALLVISLLSMSVFANTDTIIHVSQPGDSQMNCDEINAEITAMENVMAEAKSSQSASNLAGIGASVAGHFAGLLGGGAGAAVATTGANAVVNNNKQSAEERLKAAEQRRTMLMGMHTGKGCNDPMLEEQ